MIHNLCPFPPPHRTLSALSARSTKSALPDRTSSTTPQVRLPALCQSSSQRHFIILVLLPALPLHAQLPSAAPEPQPLPHPELPAPPPIPEGIALWVWIVSGLLAAAMFGLILWLLLRPRPLPPAPPLNPRLNTLRALRQLRAAAPEMPPAETGHQVSIILRQYLQDRYRIPARCRTTPELFDDAAPVTAPVSASTGVFEIRQVRSAVPHAPRVFAPLAELWDRLAFAPLPATSAEAVQLIETAIQRVEEDPA